MFSSRRIAMSSLGLLSALGGGLSAPLTDIQAELAMLNMKPHELEAFRRKRHLETVAKRTHPRAKGRGRVWRSLGAGGLRARQALWERAKGKTWHEAQAELVSA